MVLQNSEKYYEFGHTETLHEPSLHPDSDKWPKDSF